MGQALASFKASLGRVRDIITDMDSNAAQALRDAATRARFETIRCACMVILSGFFESFLRNTAEESVKDMSSRGLPFSALPQRVRATHFTEGAAALMKISKEEKKQNSMVKSEDMLRRLASVNTGLNYELVWEAFADTRSNPGPSTVREFLNRFGIEESGNKLALKMKTSQGSSDLILFTFMQLRHECAHAGSAVNVPTTTETLGYCDFLETLASGIEATLQEHLNAAPFALALAATTAPVPVPATVGPAPTPVVAAPAVKSLTPPLPANSYMSRLKRLLGRLFRG
jgi:hypothetical protein